MDATPPLSTLAFSDTGSTDRASDLSLDEIGAVAVLGAMVEQRKRSASVPAECEVEALDADAVATQRRPRLDPSDDLFQKVR
ncbi:MAG TPA: hypothetical protein VM925_26205 [Labilithrix sp.]|nr:hypothetical protein [Labilithrix sp.]